MTTATSVDTAGIERELGQLWKNNALEAGGHAVTRALTLNLVARARDSATADLVSDVVQRLTASHPNRAVLAVMRPDEAEPRVEAFVQANCLLASQGQPQVCGEQITIDARGAAVAQVASLVLPLLVPDLPVALWLPGPAPFDDPLLARLRGVIDRLIVDSREFADPARDLAAMGAFEAADTKGPGAGPRGPALSDLSWATLTPWRELTAQFFDTRPLLPHLRRIDQVAISYVPPAGPRLNPTAGLLLAGWLASCLGWSPLEDAVSVEGETVRLHLRRPAVGVGPSAIRLVTIDVRPAAAEAGAAPGIASLRLRAIDGVMADFRVERTGEPGHALTAAEVAGHTPISRLARCEEPALAELLAAELRLLSRDRTFAGALRVAATLAARLP
ncbi:MAG: glucose-6-phosphate dehydrogenase assembly protein OpcA [Chloroflexales bacterium]|nr:glucose-6-phosphate dehydrogenase assembly protein OpcA [Chloroflexales bacterium]